jgi:hypothetical protein
MKPYHWRKMFDPVSESELMRCIADEKSLRMFRTICGGLPVTISGMNMTRKQYYSRLKMIVDANLVDRSNGRYCVTSLGKVVHGFLDFLETALAKDYWKYTAIDSLTDADPPLPAEERTKIVTSIMESKDTAEVLLHQ